METIPIDHWFRPEDGAAMRVCAITDDLVFLGTDNIYGYEELQKRFTHAPTHNAPDEEWQPCGILEEAKP
jgi:hypothetical protein